MDPQTKSGLIDDLARTLREYRDRAAVRLRKRVAARHSRLASLLASWDGPDAAYEAVASLAGTLDAEQECRDAGHVLAATRVLRWLERDRGAEPALLVESLIGLNLRACAGESPYETRSSDHFVRASGRAVLEGMRQATLDIDGILAGYAARIEGAPKARED